MYYFPVRLSGFLDGSKGPTGSEREWLKGELLDELLSHLHDDQVEESPDNTS